MLTCWSKLVCTREANDKFIRVIYVWTFKVDWIMEFVGSSMSFTRLSTDGEKLTGEGGGMDTSMFDLLLFHKTSSIKITS